MLRNSITVGLCERPRALLSSFAHGERGAFAVKALAVLGVLMVLALVSVGLVFGLVVPPGQMGVRLINFGPQQGYLDRSLVPGYHWRIPGYSEIFLVPRTITIFDFQRESASSAPVVPGSTSGPLEIPTADRTTVSVDAAVLVRFFPNPGSGEGAHGGPADLIRVVGASPSQWENRVRRVVEDALRKTLGELSTAQFYHPEMREVRVQRAFAQIEQSLNPLGIKLEAVLLRRYTYEEGIENAIFQKNLQELERELATKQGEFSKAEAEVRQVAAQGDAKVKTLQVEGDNRALVVRSEGDLYFNEKTAAADLLVAQAKAEVDQLRASALARSDGAEVYVARELAPLVEAIKGGVVNNVNPFDLEQWMKMLGAGGAGK